MVFQAMTRKIKEWLYSENRALKKFCPLQWLPSFQFSLWLQAVDFQGCHRIGGWELGQIKTLQGYNSYQLFFLNDALWIAVSLCLIFRVLETLSLTIFATFRIALREERIFNGPYSTIFADITGFYILIHIFKILEFWLILFQIYQFLFQYFLFCLMISSSYYFFYYTITSF